MRHLCFTIVLSTAISVAQAQVGGGRTAVGASNLDYITQQLERGKGAKIPAGVRGTPLLFTSWSKGNVVTSAGPAKAAWLKYNLATSELLWRRPAGDSLLLNTLQVKEFTIGDSLLGNQVLVRQYPVQLTTAGTLPTTFFEVLYDKGKNGLLKQRTKELNRTTTGSPSLTESQPPSWQTTTQYFVKSPQNTLTPVRLTEKSLLSALEPAHVPLLTAYLKHEHLSLKKEADATRLLAYYDSLN